MSLQLPATVASVASYASSATASHYSRTERANSTMSTTTTASTTAGQDQALQSMSILLDSVGSWIADTNSIPPFRHFEVELQPDTVSATSFMASTAPQSTDSIAGTDRIPSFQHHDLRLEDHRRFLSALTSPITTTVSAFVRNANYSPPTDRFDVDLEAQNNFPAPHAPVLRRLSTGAAIFHKRFERPITIGGTVITLVIFTLELKGQIAK